MKHWIVTLCLCPLALSCKKTEPVAADAAAASPSIERAIVPSGGCATTLTDEQSKCNGQLGSKLDKYTWKVTRPASTWDIAVTQPNELTGFRPVVILWSEPDKTIGQTDGPIVGGPVHITSKLDPGTYRISVINGSVTREPPPTDGYPYTLAITQAP